MTDNRDGDDLRKLTETVEIISKKWHPVIIQSLYSRGPLRFNELKDQLAGISGKVLTDSLDDLVEKGLVSRTVLSESPRQVEYELTSDGIDLQAALRSLASWGEQYLEPNPTVLLIDDDPRLVNMYAGWLEPDYQVERAYNGEEGLRQLSDDVDVVILDRRMPGLSGDEVLARIRDLGIDARVVMLTAVEPDLDIIEMGFDTYIMKPGNRELLRDVLTDLLTRDSYSEATEEYLVLSAKRALLESELSAVELERDQRFQWLERRLAELHDEIEDTTVPSDQLAAVFENDG